MAINSISQMQMIEHRICFELGSSKKKKEKKNSRPIVHSISRLVMYVSRPILVSRPLLRGLGLVTALTVFGLGLVLVSDLSVLSSLAVSDRHSGRGFSSTTRQWCAGWSKMSGCPRSPAVTSHPKIFLMIFGSRSVGSFEIKMPIKPL